MAQLADFAMDGFVPGLAEAGAVVPSKVEPSPRIRADAMVRRNLDFMLGLSMSDFSQTT
jgi:hypothetical protein